MKTDVDEYTVWYRILGGDNYNDVEPTPVKAIIRKVAPEIIDYPKSTGIITNDKIALFVIIPFILYCKTL